jgi:ribulose kinase
MYSHESESILLGATILGADASKKYSRLTEAMNALNVAGQVCICKIGEKCKIYLKWKN